jgi:hypothetical protein
MRFAKQVLILSSVLCVVGVGSFTAPAFAKDAKCEKCKGKKKAHCEKCDHKKGEKECTKCAESEHGKHDEKHAEEHGEEHHDEKH